MTLDWNQNNQYYNQEYRQGMPVQPPVPPEPPKKQGNRGGVFLLGMVVGIVVMTLIGCAAYVGTRFYRLTHEDELTAVNLDGISDADGEGLVNAGSVEKLETIEGIIDKYYYLDEDIDEEAMTEGMYAGIVDALGDPYSTYYTAEEWQSIMEETEGVYYGIGAYISIDSVTNCAMISGVIEDAPAQEAGLRENDIIYQVEGESTQGLELSEVVSRIKGEEGTKVHLTIYREGAENYLEIDVERRKIETPTVNYEMYDNGVGYIQITEFDDVTLDQFTEALAVVKGSGAKGLILDLRSNPGGSLSVVTDIAREILPKGLIVYTEDKYGKREEYTCDGKKELDIPLVVLINGNSASASEILAGAIKDYGKGTLIGTTTFGKGIVQRILPLTDGTALKLTISSYFTPNGNNIHGIGIEPDIECEFDSDAYYNEGVDNQLQRALQEVEDMMR